jgi:hypothetical protein
LAFSVLGNAASYLLCDLDRDSITDLQPWSRELDRRSCEVTEGDGMAAVAAHLDGEADRPRLVHIDPFDHHAQGPGGYSAFELAARVADSDAGLVYWYGYTGPEAQPDALEQLAALTCAPLWCGQMKVTGGGDSPSGPAHGLGPATFGIILANVGASTADACAALGNALSDAYANAALPDGGRWSLSFTSRNKTARP